MEEKEIMMKKMKSAQPKKQRQKLIARSPEAFPKLRIFPDGWDLDHILNRKKKQQKTKSK